MANEVVKFVRGDEVKFTYEHFEEALNSVGFVRAEKVTKPETETEPVASKEELLALAAELGLDVDKRWSVAKLLEKVTEAQEA